jgi:hypothetical protein
LDFSRISVAVVTPHLRPKGKQKASSAGIVSLPDSLVRNASRAVSARRLILTPWLESRRSMVQSHSPRPLFLS